MTNSDPMVIGLQLLALVFAVVMHEFAHGYVAYLLGDPTAKRAGRLTLNPIRHIDPVGSILVPLISSASLGVAFGWAKPVPINPSYFRNLRRDGLLVSVAGVTANLVIAAVAGLLYRMLQPGGPLGLFLVLCCLINTLLAVFNMIPVPPLDGSHVVAAFMPGRIAYGFMRIGRFGTIILVVLIASGLLRRIIEPVIRFLTMVLMGD